MHQWSITDLARPTEDWTISMRSLIRVSGIRNDTAIQWGQRAAALDGDWARSARWGLGEGRGRRGRGKGPCLG